MQENFPIPEVSSEANIILIVDDDEINREILKNLFEENYEVLEAENGRQGLELALNNQHCLCAILLDVLMPEMNGIEVLKILKERNIIEQVPVFIITSEVDATIEQAYELGAMDVIRKPIIPYLV